MPEKALIFDPIELIKFDGVSVSGHDVFLARSANYHHPKYLQIEGFRFTPTQLMVLYLSTKSKFSAGKIAKILHLNTETVYTHTKRLVELNADPIQSRPKKKEIFSQANRLELFSLDNFRLFEQIFNPDGHQDIKGRAELIEPFFD